MKNASNGRDPTALRILIAFLFLVGTLLLSVPAAADELPTGLDIKRPTKPVIPPVNDDEWRVVWTDNFDQLRPTGWDCRALTRFDKLAVVRDDYVWGDYHLEGISDLNLSGCGYRGVSPCLEEEGLNYQNPYQIRFLFMVPELEGGGTIALQSRALTLLTREVDLNEGLVELAWMDPSDPQLRPVTTLTIGRWHLIELDVRPWAFGAEGSDFRIKVDGEPVAKGSAKTIPTTHLIVCDPPAAIQDPDTGEVLMGAFGAGAWDAFSVYEGKAPPLDRGGGIKIRPNQPNPFNPSTTIELYLPEAMNVRADVYGLDGRKVTTLVNAILPSGVNALTWKGRDEAGNRVSSGIYVCRVVAAGEAHSVRMTLTR